MCYLTVRFRELRHLPEADRRLVVRVCAERERASAANWPWWSRVFSMLLRLTWLGIYLCVAYLSYWESSLPKDLLVPFVLVLAPYFNFHWLWLTAKARHRFAACVRDELPGWQQQRAAAKPVEPPETWRASDPW